MFEDSGPGVQAVLAADIAVVAGPNLKAAPAASQTRCLAVLPSLEAACERSREGFGFDFALEP